MSATFRLPNFPIIIDIYSGPNIPIIGTSVKRLSVAAQLRRWPRSALGAWIIGTVVSQELLVPAGTDLRDILTATGGADYFVRQGTHTIYQVASLVYDVASGFSNHHWAANVQIITHATPRD